jgi:hypothetical protein
MKMPPLSLESKVLLTAFAICVYGFLRVTHVIHLSDRYENYPLFLIAFVLAALVLGEDRDSSASNGVYLLSNGLLFWNMMTLDNSIGGVIFRWLFAMVSGVGLFKCGLSALKYIRRWKK